MPAFDKFAYSDGRCYGLKQADLKTRQLDMFDPPATLAPNEVGYLADFLMAKVVGKGPMDHAKCVAFWGSEVEVCAEPVEHPAMIRTGRDDVFQCGEKFLARDAQIGRPSAPHPRFVDQRFADVEEHGLQGHVSRAMRSSAINSSS